MSHYGHVSELETIMESYQSDIDSTHSHACHKKQEIVHQEVVIKDEVLVLEVEDRNTIANSLEEDL